MRIKLTISLALVLLASVLLVKSGQYLLGLFGLAFRSRFLFSFTLIAGMLLIMALCGGISWLQLYRKRFSLIVRTAGSLIIVGFICFLLLFGYLFMVMGARHEYIVERNGMKLLAEVNSWHDADIYYYAYKNPLIRGKESLINEWYSGIPNPLTRNPIPQPTKVYYDKTAGYWGNTVEGVSDNSMQHPINEPPAQSEEPDSGNEAVSPIFANEEEFLNAIKDTVLDGYEKIEDNKWIVQNDSTFVRPINLTGYKLYDYPFFKDDPGNPGNRMLLQLWYNPQTFELLTVTQNSIDGPDSNGMFVFTDKTLDGKPVSSLFPWVSYMAMYPIDKNGLSVYGYMLVNDGEQKDECERILTSLGDN